MVLKNVKGILNTYKNWIWHKFVPAAPTITKPTTIIDLNKIVTDTNVNNDI